jgi:hypothetical protein
MQWCAYKLGDGTVLQYIRYCSPLVAVGTNKTCYAYLPDIRDSLPTILRTLEMISSCTLGEVWASFYRGTGGSGGRFDIYGETSMLDTLDWLEHLLVDRECLDLFLVSDRWSTILCHKIVSQPTLLHALSVERYIVPVFLRIFSECPIEMCLSTDKNLLVDDVLSYFSFFDHLELSVPCVALFKSIAKTRSISASTQDHWIHTMRQEYPHLFEEYSLLGYVYPCFMQISAHVHKYDIYSKQWNSIGDCATRHIPRLPSTAYTPQIIHLTDECAEAYERSTRYRLLSFVDKIQNRVTQRGSFLLHIDVCGTTETLYHDAWMVLGRRCEHLRLSGTRTVRTTTGLVDGLVSRLLVEHTIGSFLLPWYLENMPPEGCLSLRNTLLEPQKIHGYPNVLLQLRARHTTEVTCSIVLCSPGRQTHLLLRKKRLRLLGNNETLCHLTLPYCTYPLFPSSTVFILFKEHGFLPSRLWGGHRTIDVTRAELGIPVLVE